MTVSNKAKSTTPAKKHHRAGFGNPDDLCPFLAFPSFTHILCLLMRLDFDSFCWMTLGICEADVNANGYSRRGAQCRKLRSRGGGYQDDTIYLMPGHSWHALTLKPGHIRRRSRRCISASCIFPTAFTLFWQVSDRPAQIISLRQVFDRS